MRRAATALGLLVLLVACTSPAPAAPTRAASTTALAPSADATPTPELAPVVVQQVAPRTPASPSNAPGASLQVLPSPVALPLSVLAGRSGADVRVTLDRLLQEQVFLTALAMNAAANSRLDELIGASGALDSSSTTLAEVVGAVKGQAAAQNFLDAWRGQAADLVQYTAGQQSSALGDLDRRRVAIVAQLATGDVSIAQLDELLRARTQAQLALADAAAAHDEVRLADGLRTTVASADQLGAVLTRTFATQAPTLVPRPTDGLDIDVRLQINLLLHERVWLTAAASTAGAGGRTREMQAFSAAADVSATELGQQLAAIWGDDLGTGLADRLRAQTSALVAAGSGVDRRQNAADIERLRTEMDGLLAGANPLLPRGLLSQQLRASDQPLLSASDAFAARDYVVAYSRAREAARQMQKPADALALSIVDRYPGRYLVLPTPLPDGP